MTVQDRIELIEEAQELLRQAIHNIQSATNDSPDRNYYQAYIIRSLRNMIDGDDNPYDANLDAMIQVLTRDEESMLEYNQ
jgi:hypothetical protein